MALLSAACLSVPSLEPDVVGIGDLDAPPPDNPQYPSAADLVRLGDSCAGREIEWCQGGNTVPEYHFGPGDRLTVSVWGRTDLGSQQTTEASERVSTVQTDGTIFLPFLGNVEVSGKSAAGVRQMLSERYEEIQETPQVEVHVSGCASRSVQVDGEVATPGPVHLCFDRMTLGDVIARAGGLTERADASRGVLVRRQVPLDLDFSSMARGESSLGSLVLEGGDSVFFPSLSEESYYVFGEARRQGFFPIPREGITVLGALASVGGYDVTTARVHRIFLVRLHGQDRPVIHQLDFEELLSGPEIQIVAGDRIFVPPTSLATWNRWWRQIFPFSIGNRVINQID